MIDTNAVRNAKNKIEKIETGAMLKEAYLKSKYGNDPSVMEIFQLLVETAQPVIEKNKQIINQYELTK